jgi:hypothetical protein
MKKVMFLDDERSVGNGVIVTLNKGWKFDSDPLVPTHVMGFDNHAEARQAIHYAVKCDCADCEDRPGG